MLHTKTAEEIRDLFLSGEKTAEEITTHFLARIEKFNPKFGAFLSVFPTRALQKAKELDQKRKEGKPLGKLAAIPIAIKDNIHVEGEITTCGSKFLTNYKAPFSASAVKRIEEEDGIILGKTNLDEFAMGSSTENSALLTTLNPWNLECVPGGSSGGSAAAVSAGLAPLALGTDTGGSIRQPAAFCGIVGMKPTYGRVSRFGLVAFGSSLDQIGPFAKTSADAALLLDVIGTPCPNDSTSIKEEDASIYSGCKEPCGPLSIGIPKGLEDSLQGENLEQFIQAKKTLEEAGHTLKIVDLSLTKYATATYYILATAEASTNLARFDGIRYGVRSKEATTLQEVYNFSKEEGFGPEVKRRIMLGTFVLSSGYQNAYYKKAQKLRTLMIRQFADAFAQVDLIAMPTTPSAAFKKGAIAEPLDMYLQDLFTIPTNLVGIPTISIPQTLSSEGLPLGLQLLAPQKQDAFLMRASHAVEKLFIKDPLYPKNFAEGSV